MSGRDGVSGAEMSTELEGAVRQPRSRQLYLRRAYIRQRRGTRSGRSGCGGLRRAEDEEKSPDHYPGSSLGRCTSERRYSALLASSDQDQLLGSFLVCVRAAEKKPPTGVATAVGEVTGKKPFGLEYRFTEQR